VADATPISLCGWLGTAVNQSRADLQHTLATQRLRCIYSTVALRKIRKGLSPVGLVVVDSSRISGIVVVTYLGPVTAVGVVGAGGVTGDMVVAMATTVNTATVNSVIILY